MVGTILGPEKLSMASSAPPYEPQKSVYPHKNLQNSLCSRVLDPSQCWLQPPCHVKPYRSSPTVCSVTQAASHACVGSRPLGLTLLPFCLFPTTCVMTHWPLAVTQPPPERLGWRLVLPACFSSGCHGNCHHSWPPWEQEDVDRRYWALKHFPPSPMTSYTAFDPWS